MRDLSRLTEILPTQIRSLTKNFEEMEEAMVEAKEVQTFVEIASQAATSFDEDAGALNEGLGCVHKLIAAAAATSATSISSGDKAENE